jgi:hypothetical protein
MMLAVFAGRALGKILRKILSLGRDAASSDPRRGTRRT